MAGEIAEERDVAAAGAGVPRGRTRWGSFALAALAAVPVLVVGLLVVALAAFALADDEEVGRFVAEEAGCGRALGFGGAALPAGAEAESCTVAHGADTAYTAVFRMPRADVRDWLAGTYPDAPAPRTVCADADADLCLDVGLSTEDLPAAAEAHAVQVTADHQDARTTLVRFSAFTLWHRPAGDAEKRGAA
ncbi:hypothetical protein [Streptomyces cinereospinus]|uniref:Septum formation-related domain-containing protein n=1 Tax=Streptomyces cinereospinus TaxID=285561 RepID=A0ABV5N2S5_9ACTN